MSETEHPGPFTGNVHLECRVCCHRWCIQIRYPVPIERFKEALDGMCFIGCPACGHCGEDVLVQDVLGGEYNR